MFKSRYAKNQLLVFILSLFICDSVNLENGAPDYTLGIPYAAKEKTRFIRDGLHVLNSLDVASAPYRYRRHGPRHGNRHIRDCQHIKYGNVTHSIHLSHGGLSGDITLPIATTKRYIKEIGPTYNKRFVRGHVTVVNNPFHTVSVLEPLRNGSCGNDSADRATVEVSAEQKDCLVAVNAGFFNTHNGACLGNVVSDGKLVLDSGGIQNAHFGIMKNGSVFFGYLNEELLLEDEFVELVGGVIWIIRDGESYVRESIAFECEDTEETGTLQVFADVNSARTAVGVDKNGHVVIVQVDGKTHSSGMSLWEFSDYLLELGVVNAINLDGGGSGTFVMNGTLANYPTDHCKDDKSFTCARKVSTILCVHLPACTPEDCSGHGDCVLGKCQCDHYWTGETCDQLTCPLHCNNNGICTEDGCMCNKGWLGMTCNISCPVGRYGLNCSEACQCENGAKCSTVDGRCDCPAGFTGKLCDRSCPYGYFGHGCKAECYCPNDCTCDPITGGCQYSLNGTNIFKAAYCLMEQVIEAKHLVVDQPEQYRLCLTSIILLGVIAAVSIFLNLSLLCVQCLCRRNRKRRRRKFQRTYGLKSDNDESANEGDRENSSEDSSSDEEETSFIQNVRKPTAQSMLLHSVQ